MTDEGEKRDSPNSPDFFLNWKPKIEDPKSLKEKEILGKKADAKLRVILDSRRSGGKPVSVPKLKDHKVHPEILNREN